MKKYILFILLTIAVYGGCTGGPSTTRIYGEIKGFMNDTVYLYGVNESAELFDVIRVIDHSFNHSLTVDTLTEAMLVFRNGKQYPLYFDRGDEIRIEGDTTSLDKLHITGNNLNENLTGIIASLEAGSNDSLQALMADSFIRRNNTLLINIYLLDRYLVQRPDPDYIRISGVIDAMIGDLQDKPYVTELKKVIEDSMQSDIGQIAPPFSLADKNGDLVSRTDYSKKYLLIHFWASWDSIGRKSHTDLRRLNRQYRRNENFDILGISLDMDKESWRRAIKEDTLTWKQVSDFTGWESTVIKQYGIRKLPANLLIGPGGRVLERNIPGDSLKTKLDALLN